EKHRGTIRSEPRSIRSDQHIGLQFVTERQTNLVQIGRADLLRHLHDEFRVETEFAAARIPNRAKSGEVDAMLTLVVSGAAAVDAIAYHCRPPGIEPIAPLADHAVDDVAMAVHQ